MHFDLAFLIMNRKYSFGVFFGGGGGGLCFLRGLTNVIISLVVLGDTISLSFHRKTLSSIFDLTRDPAPEKKV